MKIKEDKVYPKGEYPIIPTKEIFRQAQKSLKITEWQYIYVCEKGQIQSGMKFNPDKVYPKWESQITSTKEIF